MVISIYECENKQQLIKYYHTSLGSHPKRTLIEGANAGYIKGCPGLTAAAISKYLSVEDVTEMGHMKQKQQGTQSTTNNSRRGRSSKQTQQSDTATSIADAISLPTEDQDNNKTHLVFMSVKRVEGYIATNQTGRFPRTSNKGMQYICVFYIYDPDNIKGVALKSRRKEDILRAYQEVYTFCQNRGFKPKLHKIDNETSKYFEDFIASLNTHQQYTPPDLHRTNPAERALQPYKSYVKSTMAYLPPTFPIAYWCRLLLQIDFSVNIVRKCRQNPLLSAWAAIEGEFHFNATPIAPPGSEMLMHENPNRGRTFVFNAKKAWYIAPCFQHYRKFKGIMASTGAERISDTVQFKHHAISIPQLTPDDRILEAERQLDSAIKQQPKNLQWMN